MKAMSSLILLLMEIVAQLENLKKIQKEEENQTEKKRRGEKEREKKREREDCRTGQGHLKNNRLISRELQLHMNFLLISFFLR